MARIKFGAIVQSINGSIGGTTFQRNRYGFTVKQKPNIVKPNKPNQLLRQAEVAEVSREWRTLSNVQRTSWNAYAAAYPVSSRLNQNAYLDGYAYFLRYRENVRTARATGVKDDPNGLRNDLTSVLINGEWTGSTALLTGVLSSIPASSTIAIFMSNQLPPGVEYGKPPLKFIMQTTGGPTISANINSSYQRAFGIVPFANMVADVQLVIVNEEAAQVDKTLRIRIPFEE